MAIIYERGSTVNYSNCSGIEHALFVKQRPFMFDASVNELMGPNLEIIVVPN